MASCGRSGCGGGSSGGVAVATDPSTILLTTDSNSFTHNVHYTVSSI